MANALALEADEGRDKQRYASGSCKQLGSITLSSKVFCLPSILSSTSLCNSSIFSIIIFLVSSLNPNLSNKSKYVSSFSSFFSSSSFFFNSSSSFFFNSSSSSFFFNSSSSNFFFSSSLNSSSFYFSFLLSSIAKFKGKLSIGSFTHNSIFSSLIFLLSTYK